MCFAQVIPPSHDSLEKRDPETGFLYFFILLAYNLFAVLRVFLACDNIQSNSIFSILGTF